MNRHHINLDKNTFNLYWLDISLFCIWWTRARDGAMQAVVVNINPKVDTISPRERKRFIFLPRILYV